MNEVKRERIKEDGEVEFYTEKVQRPAFKSIPVFDISQTEGKELPLNETKDLTGAVPNYSELTKSLIKSIDAKVIFKEFDNDAKGLYSISRNEIYIKKGMSEAQTLKTLVHEIAHSLMHTKEAVIEEGITRQESEIEAESVAYIVCSYLGIDASDYSFPYIASWAKNMDNGTLRQSMTDIISTSDRLINAMSHELELADREKYGYQLGREFTFIDCDINNKKVNPEKLLNAHEELMGGEVDKYIDKLNDYLEKEMGDKERIKSLITRLKEFSKGLTEDPKREVAR